MFWIRKRCIAALYLARKLKEDVVAKRLEDEGANITTFGAGLSAILCDLEGKMGAKCSDTQKEVNKTFGHLPLSSLEQEAKKALGI